MIFGPVSGAGFESSVLEPLLETLGGIRRGRRTLLVGIDGGGGAGKSTLARELERAGHAVSVVEFDDFYRPSTDREARAAARDPEVGGDFDWRRLRDQVLVPLSGDRAARYQRYDWDEDKLADWLTVTVGGTVIIEGCYCTRRDLFGFYDYTIWVEAPLELRLTRGLERGGPNTAERWLTDWLPEEATYLEAESPAARVNLVVDGLSPRTPPPPSPRGIEA